MSCCMLLYIIPVSVGNCWGLILFVKLCLARLLIGGESKSLSIAQQGLSFTSANEAMRKGPELKTASVFHPSALHQNEG